MLFKDLYTYLKSLALIIENRFSRAREVLAKYKINASKTMDLYLYAIFDISNYYSSSETKINLKKKIKSRLITRRDKPLL
jgi:hypothetical protein